MIRLIVTLLLLSSVISLNLRAQRLNPQDWNKKVESEHFIEGTYSLPVSSAIDLISFHSSFEKIESGKNQQLYFSIRTPTAGSFLLKVQERKIKDYYMLESQPGQISKGSNLIGPWDINSFLKSFDIPSDNLAVVCRLNEHEKDYILPVSVQNENNKDRSDSYKAVFRLSKKITKGSCSVYLGKQKGKMSTESLVQTSKIGRHPGGATVEIVLDKTKLEGHNGWVTVHLSLVPSGSRKRIPYSFYFYHSP